MMNLFKRWSRTLAWTFFGILIWLVLLPVLLWLWANWQGPRMWNHAVALLKAERESIDFRAATSEPVPDAENFCAIPALKNISVFEDGDPDAGEPAVRRKRLNAVALPKDGKAGKRPKHSAGASAGSPVDLKTWCDWLRRDGSLSMPKDSGDAARDVLAALAKHDGIISELAAGLDRPHTQWTPALRTRELPRLLAALPVPHYSVVQEVTRTLGLRAAAAAKAGDAAKAHESLLLMAKLNEACRDEPFLIGMLVAATGTTLIAHTTWEVCDAQSGSVADFERLESVLARVDLKRASLQAMRGELASSLNTITFMGDSRRSRAGLLMLVSPNAITANERVLNGAAAAMPSGFFSGSAAVLLENNLKHHILPLRDQGWQDAVTAESRYEEILRDAKARMVSHPFYLMTAMFTPSTMSVIRRAAYTQCLIDQATIACVLERHRIEKGGYPAALEGLKLASGTPLPMDALSRKPMGYRKTDNGKYALWCIGFDGGDDGGKRGIEPNTPSGAKFSAADYKGDWVWDFPAAK